MADRTAQPNGVHRKRLFAGICLALIPTGASFALVSNILVQLKQEFILTNYQVGLIAGAALWGMAISLLVLGPLLEGFGLKNGARMAFAGHLIGLTLLISAVLRVGHPSAFWILMIGAATLAVGNGMIEVTGNPLVAALYPGNKTTYLNHFHAFFPIGIVVGGLTGFLLATLGGPFGYWPYQLAVIYVPVLIYGSMVLFRQFPKTENAAAGIPVGEMFRYTLTHPLFLLMLAMMALTTSLELGPMRWVPAVLEAGGMHGILVLIWISGWMVLLRLLAGHFVEQLSPPGMLLVASILTGSGLFLLSVVQGLAAAFAAATIFAWGVAFFFPTMVGTVSERMPKTGSLGIVLMAGVGLGMAGAVGVPLIGKLADGYLAGELPPGATVALLRRVAQRFPAYVDRAGATKDLARLGYRETEVRDALQATRAALAAYERTGHIRHDATANALRAIVGTAVPNEPLVGEADAILRPAEAYGGQRSFRYVAPAALILIAVFGTMYLRDRRRGGYQVQRLARTDDAATGEPMAEPRLRFVTGKEMQVERLPWGPHEWLSRPGLTAAERLLLVRVHMPPGEAHRFHRHPAMEEIVYVVSGIAEQWVDRESRVLGPGEVAHIPRDVVHATYNAGEDTLVFLAILSPAETDGPALVDMAYEEPWRSLKPPVISPAGAAGRA